MTRKTCELQELTDRQRDILAYIRECIGNGIPPTIRDICDKFGINSTNGVVGHLNALEGKGWLLIDHNQDRGLRLTKAAKLRLDGIPLLDPATLARFHGLWEAEREKAAKESKRQAQGRK